MIEKQKILKSMYPGKIRIGEIDLECHVLEDKSRIFSSRDVLKAFALETESKDHPRVLITFLDRLRVVSIPNDDLLQKLSTPIKFIRSGRGGLPTNGYSAELIPAICDLVLQLSTTYSLPFDLKEAAIRSRILLNAFANIGILALVDEATGYQDIRDRNALQEILDKYLLENYAAWAKRFPDEFYKEMFRLKGWQWKGMSINRPGVVGTYTRAIVYARLAPGVLEELEKKNPPLQSGRRRVKHHQYLTEDIGHPALDKHITGVIALMRASPSWAYFTYLLKRSFPVVGEQIELDLLDE